MKRPARVRVLGKQINYRWVDTLEHEGEELNGLADYDGQDVQIRSGLPLETEQEKVLHETLHIIECAMEMDLEDEVIARFANGLLAVIKDNPSFVSYLRRKK
jgi:hypothetical protein